MNVKSNSMKRHEEFIRQCVKLADKSLKSGDLPFGAVLVKDNKIIAEGQNSIKVKHDITGHAEINAIKKALAENPDLDLSQCILYSNVEPCPMCSFIIRDYGIGGLVYSLSSYHMGGYTRWKILTADIPHHMLDRAKDKQVPFIVSDILPEEAARTLDALDWQMHKC